MGFWSLLRHIGSINETIDSGQELLKAADTDKDGKIDMDDLKRWMDDTKVLMALLNVINNVVKLVRLFRKG